MSIDRNLDQAQAGPDPEQETRHLDREVESPPEETGDLDEEYPEGTGLGGAREPDERPADLG